jgi:hypothetical protein
MRRLVRLVASLVRARRMVPRMTTAWDLTLSIDAHGHDDTHVAARPAGTGSQQLVVRVGLVTVHCLDGASAMSAGLAWATARLHARSWLPDLQDHPEQWPTAARADSSEYGAAYPTGSVLLEGRQRWQVTPRGMALGITVGPLHVTVHDWTALDTHVRAWTEATAIATRVFPGKSMPFSRLVDQARRNASREWDAQIERRGTPGGRSRPEPRERP